VKTGIQTVLVILLLFFCLVAVMPASVSAKSVNWRKYDEGVAMGKAEGKKLFINFYATWCRFCTVMDNTTFKDSETIDYLNKYFIPIKVNVDRNRKPGALYRVSGLPTSLFVTEDGKTEIKRFSGYIPPEMLIKILRYLEPQK